MKVVGIEGDYPGDRPGLVFGATGIAEDWPSVRIVLLEAFRLTQKAIADDEPMVYVISTNDLLGRNGPASAAVAAALVAGAKTAAIELAKTNLSINVIAIDDEVSTEQVQQWVLSLLDGNGPQGELMHLGPGHLGKALG